MLTGKNIKLVHLEKEDLPRARVWVNDTFLLSRILRVLPVTEADQEKWYEDIIQNPSKIVFAVKTSKDGQHIGNTGLYHIDWLHRRAEFWILIGEQNFWGKGIGTEVVSMMQRYAFESLNLNRLYLHVGLDNQGAITLYKKLNFVQEGLLKEHYCIQGKYLDVMIMAILRNDFDPKE